MYVKSVLLSVALVLTAAASGTSVQDDSKVTSERIRSLVEEKVEHVMHTLKNYQMRQTTEAAFFLKSLALKSKARVSVLAEDCSSIAKQDIENGRKLAFDNFSKCSVLVIFEDITEFVVYTSTFIGKVAAEATIIVVNFMSCFSSGNPFSLVYCLYKAIVAFPGEIYDIVEAIENYNDSVLQQLLPQLIQDVKACLGNHSREYQLALATLEDQAVKCHEQLLVY